ncbi:hypothetical protein PT974_02633 [Cladobotryum mycophilum]|uniref:Gem-associated protein 5 TPR domain-containing protein n=1 Tax=Cladobotryum mycophilum TaxID=491253 RepID=A0ABR0SYS0_9HYPO
MSASSRNYTVSNRSGMSSTARGGAPPIQDFPAVPTAKDLKYFTPSAATASMFLYAQGSSIVCCHHDSLTIDRRFSRHADEIQLLAVDSVSEHGAGRLAVSYDAGQTTIVWDLMTGDEMARFSSYEHLTVAAWMRNGNVAFGNTQGNIILFEPSTSEHISSRTIDQIAVTALAPSSDCRTFAIGYSNGSLLIATLQPRFTILHNLTTSRGPSPIVTLSWHASSSRQKSDMLAVQTHDGDLRVWSVTKSYDANDPAKVVRILRRNENYLNGPNWMGWSKNGRIIQYSDSETLSWDVRTKHVTHDSIPTLEHVKGVAVYGPGASLFTLGPNNTVQQFDLNSPAIMVANVQHPAALLPPSPPTSEETGGRSVHSATTIHTSESESSSVPIEMGISESDDDHLSPFARLAKRGGPELINDVYESGSPVSSRSGVSSVSKSSTGSRTPGRQAASLRSRGMTENTYISAGSSMKTTTVSKKEPDSYSMGYSLPSTSAPSLASSRSRHRPSRLRNEIPRSPEESIKVHDLFQYTRSRLSDIPYKQPMMTNNSRLTNDDLRRQMLTTIFGWHREMDDLVRDEMSRHPAGSANRILLAKWLGDMESDIMAASSQNMTSSDWMLLALSGIGGQASQHKLGRAYVQRLLENGDLHVAVTIMLGMGDDNDAIEIYVSHKQYMEALILTCISFPSVWERQAAIIRKWGEWAVQHGQQQLAIRCFACTGQESTEPWTSPSATQLNFQSINPSIPEVLSPPLSPPGIQRGPQRSIAKTSALKLITSFGDPNQKAKFYSQDGGQTPIAAGVTPIAESALSPGGAYDTATAFLRPSNNSRFNTPTSARPGGQGFGRNRLPSIGEIPADLGRDIVKARERATPTIERASHSRKASAAHDNMAMGTALQRAATASPMMMRDRFQHATQNLHDERPPSPDHGIIAKMQQVQASHRTGSRDRNLRGLHLQLQNFEQPSLPEVASPEQSLNSSKYHWPSRRRGPGSVASSITSASSAGRNIRSNTKVKDDYIHSLDAAQHYSKKTRSRPGSKERAREPSTGRHASRERRGKSRDTSEERGRSSGRGYNKPKRSPTSPVPMSPEDLAILSTQKYFEATPEPLALRKANSVKGKPTSRTSSRGRSKGRNGSRNRSPSSPVPLSATALHYQGSEDEEDYQRAMQAHEEFRAKHSRSVSRGLNSPAVSRRELSESRRKDTAEALDILAPLVHNPLSRAASTEHAGDLRRMKDDRQRKKEQAARELEERRRSLAKRQPVTPIPHPSQISPVKLPVAVEAEEEILPEGIPPRCATEPPRSMYARGGPHIGLPATPKAMRLIIHSDDESPDVPPIPATFSQRHSPKSPPKKEEEGPLLTLLPSTRSHLIIRAIIVERAAQERRGALTISSKGDGMKNNNYHRHPPPPFLKELQHLAVPPPPPPAPLPHMPRTVHNGGAIGSGMIEIVMDDDEPEQVVVAAPNDGMVPVLPPPAPPVRGHHRGRSSNGGGSVSGSVSGRGSRAAERKRSASRTRKNSVKGHQMEGPLDMNILNQLRSPTSSVPPPVMYDPDLVRSPIEVHRRTNSTGLHRSEMF